MIMRTMIVPVLSLVLIRRRLSVAGTHAVSLEPRLHLDKANFSLTAATDKGN
jgi:hypothetical protein